MDGAKAVVGALATRQAGRVKGVQLVSRGIGRGQMRHWIETGYLIRRLPTVYAVGHLASTPESALWEAILYAGPGAMLRGHSGAQWRRLIEFAPARVQVCTPRRCRSLPEVDVADRSRRRRFRHRELPVCSTADVLLDLAAAGEHRLVRKALGRLDFRHELNLRELNAACSLGRAGSPALRWALAHHDPRFDRANGPLAFAFLELCEREGIPMPLVEHPLHGIQVDAYWPAARLVVELDGFDNHGSRGQVRLDRSQELTLRAHGIMVVRYTWDLVHERPHAVRDDVLRLLRERDAEAVSTGAVPRSR